MNACGVQRFKTSGNTGRKEAKEIPRPGPSRSRSSRCQCRGPRPPRKAQQAVTVARPRPRHPPTASIASRVIWGLGIRLSRGSVGADRRRFSLWSGSHCSTTPPSVRSPGGISGFNKSAPLLKRYAPDLDSTGLDWVSRQRPPRLRRRSSWHRHPPYMLGLQ